MKETVAGEVEKVNIVEVLKSSPITEIISRRRITETASKLEGENVFKHDLLDLSDSEKREVVQVIDILESSAFQSLVQDGKVTVGLVKPEAHIGHKLPDNDLDAEAYLLGLIGNKVLLSFSTVFAEEDVEAFYAPIKEKYDVPERLREGNGTIWESIVNYTSNAPLTVVLIYDESGNAVEWWRAKMGHTRADRAEPESIRGMHANVEELPNNLVHGSDSVESAVRETEVVVSHLKRVRI